MPSVAVIAPGAQQMQRDAAGRGGGKLQLRFLRGAGSRKLHELPECFGAEGCSRARHHIIHTESRAKSYKQFGDERWMAVRRSGQHWRNSTHVRKERLSP